MHGWPLNRGHFFERAPKPPKLVIFRETTARQAAERARPRYAVRNPDNVRRIGGAVATIGGGATGSSKAGSRLGIRSMSGRPGLIA